MEIKHLQLSTYKSFEFVNIKENHKKEFFKAHIHDFYELVFITKGKGKHAIDFKEFPLEKNLLYLIKPTQVHQWLIDDFHNEYEGYILLFSKDILKNDTLVNQLFLNNFSSSITITKKTLNEIFQLLKMIEDAYLDEDSLLISHLFSAFLRYLLKEKRTSVQDYTDNRIYELINLIEENYKKEKSPSFYAKKMDLTTKRLNDLTHKYLDKTLSQLISDRIILEAKRDLSFTDKSIKELSEELGFFDPSYFSRFFKKHTKLSPLFFKDKSKNTSK